MWPFRVEPQRHPAASGRPAGEVVSFRCSISVLEKPHVCEDLRLELFGFACLVITRPQAAGFHVCPHLTRVLRLLGAFYTGALFLISKGFIIFNIFMYTACFSPRLLLTSRRRVAWRASFHCWSQICEQADACRVSCNGPNNQAGTEGTDGCRASRSVAKTSSWHPAGGHVESFDDLRAYVEY